MSGKSGVVEWNVEALTKAIDEEMEERVTMAAEVVEGAARLNLMRIGEPKWGKGYRMAVAYKGLTHVVKRTANAIEARIGMKKSVDLSGVQKHSQHFAFYIETGSRKWPANPWLRPALLHNLENIKAILGIE